MSLSVNPVSSSYYATAAAAAYVNNANTVNNYDQLLAIEDALLASTSSSSGSGSVDAGLASSDLLSLSPAALNILNGIDNTGLGTSDNLTLTGTVAGATTTLNLTAAQQSQVAAILAQYANQPVTQQTFTDIENALTTAGINPQQISIQQLLGAYNLSYGAGFAFNDQLFTETLASELDNA